MEYKYIFSIVMAVYNCEPFLRETLDSVVNQKIKGFKKIKNKSVSTAKSLTFEDIVQVIMVDDGSTDGSGEICDEYANKYPNFMVVHKENGGVASARNEGLKHVQGKYMNFMDSDDKFSDNVLIEVYNFFEKHYEETDVVTMPLVYFDAAKHEHWQNDKFQQGDRVIDLNEEYHTALKFVNASFFKSEYKREVEYDGALPCGEDIKYIFDVLSRKMTLGVVENPRYMYRKRSTGEDSLVASSKKKRSWYFEYFTNLVDWSVDFYKSKFGYVPLFLQYTLLTDILFRFKQEYTSTAIDVLGESDFEEYKKVLYNSLACIDDKLILEEKRLSVEHKYMMLCHKYGIIPKLEVLSDDIRICIEDTEMYFSDFATRIDFMNIDNGKLSIEGYTVLPPVMENEFVSVYLQVKSSEGEELMIPCVMTERKISRLCLKELLSSGVGFRGEIDVRKIGYNAEVNLIVCVDNCTVKNKSIDFGKFCPISKRYENSYYYNKEGCVITYSDNTLHLKSCSEKNAIAFERVFLKELKSTKKIGDKKAYIARKAVRLLSKFKSKPIWLILDRRMIADDNGLALFKYICREKKKVKAYFVLDPKSSDYESISKIGKVLPYDSFKHKLGFLMADAVISSQGEDYVFNPFRSLRHAYSDILADKPFFFLQHGVTKDDISGWLNRFNKNIQGFVTSAKPEYESILKYDFYYDESKVWLTGMPRNDYLIDRRQKMITFMPTWRSYLANTKERFLQSEFLIFYRSLFSNERLLSVAEEYGYKLCVKPHPQLIKYIDELQVNPKVKILDATVKYQDVFAESSLVVTDYSSAVFDFAYMRKPVVYAQFDSDMFFSGEHTYTKGYFDYEKNGFGEVLHDLDSTVDTIIDYMKNDCKMKDEYKRRAEEFFAFHDQNNCERVYNKIVEYFND
ncbi:MAG: CDP-glycerol glycerophosphotransferase family protein [Lachnospiraceae bacterium]|nr:CDP-glycerol glycerophosphotransferase family protein [Lachnospiraceae bacterium]